MPTRTSKKKSSKKRLSANTQTLDRIHHVAIPVTDIVKAVEWYTSRFNCRVDYVDETWALLEFDNAKLALVLPDEHPSHFALCRSDASTFGKLVAHRDGLHSVYIRDAFGNSIEILQER